MRYLLEYHRLEDGRAAGPVGSAELLPERDFARPADSAVLQALLEGFLRGGDDYRCRLLPCFHPPDSPWGRDALEGIRVEVERREGKGLFRRTFGVHSPFFRALALRTTRRLAAEWGRELERKEERKEDDRPAISWAFVLRAVEGERPEEEAADDFVLSPCRPEWRRLEPLPQAGRPLTLGYIYAEEVEPGRLPVYIAGEVFQEIKREVLARYPQEIGGLLGGRLCQDEAGHPFLHIAAQVMAQTIGTRYALDFTPDDVVAMAREVERLGLSPAGWHHVHNLDMVQDGHRSGLFLSERDVELHWTAFGQPTRVALVGDGNQILGRARPFSCRDCPRFNSCPEERKLLPRGGARGWALFGWREAALEARGAWICR